MATTPAVVPTPRTKRCDSGRLRPDPLPCMTRKATMVPITTTLLATGAKAAAAKRRSPLSRAVATAPTA